MFNWFYSHSKNWPIETEGTSFEYQRKVFANKIYKGSCCNRLLREVNNNVELGIIRNHSFIEQNK